MIRELKSTDVPVGNSLWPTATGRLFQDFSLEMQKRRNAASACTRKPKAAGLLPFGSDPVWLAPPQLEAAFRLFRREHAPLQVPSEAGDCLADRPV
jgi:hypothetical protein